MGWQKALEAVSLTLSLSPRSYLSDMCAVRYSIPPSLPPSLHSHLPSFHSSNDISFAFNSLSFFFFFLAVFFCVRRLRPKAFFSRKKSAIYVAAAAAAAAAAFSLLVYFSAFLCKNSSPFPQPSLFCHVCSVRQRRYLTGFSPFGETKMLSGKKKKHLILLERGPNTIFFPVLPPF